MTSPGEPTRTRRGPFAALLVLVVLLMPLAVFAAPGAAAEGGLRAVVVPASADPGTTIRITGEGWPANARLQMMTCGNLGRGGTPSCDVARTYTTVANPSGAFETYGTMGKPPAPCPCVMHIVDADTTQAVDIPVTVVGKRTAEPPPPSGAVGTTPPVQVVSTEVTGWGPVSAWFGARPHRTLELTVRNTTKAAITGARLQLFPDGGSAASPLSTTTLPDLAADQITTVRVPLPLDAGVGGTTTIHGQVNGGPVFTVHATSWAWGFFLLDAVLLALFVALLVRRFAPRPRQRPQGRHAQPRVRQPV